MAKKQIKEHMLDSRSPAPVAVFQYTASETTGHMLYIGSEENHAGD